MTRLFACGLGALLLLTVTAYLYGVQQRRAVAESPLAWPVDDPQPEAIARADVDPVPPANDPATQNLPTPSIEPAELARLINEELRAVGIESVHVQVDHAYVATLRGIVASRHEHDALVGFVESIGEIVGVRDQLQVRRPAPTRPEESRARPTVLPEPVIRAEAPRESQYLEPDRLVSDINRALIQGGFDGVHAEVDPRGQIALRGTVRGAGQKVRAFALARSIGHTESVRDLVFVVEE